MLTVEAATPATLTIPEAARVLGISVALAYKAAQSGQLPVIRIGDRILVSKQALEQRLADGR